eukprot:2544366-Alexandrium_andersonii.AAC.1
MRRAAKTAQASALVLEMRCPFNGAQKLAPPARRPQKRKSSACSQGCTPRSLVHTPMPAME